MEEKHDVQLKGFNTLNNIFPNIDVIDDLISDDSNKPLSAKQGKKLKELIDNIPINSGQIEVDDNLSNTSTNPVQNKVITNKINTIETKVNSLESNSITVDSELSTTSDNPVKNSTIANKIEEIEESINNIPTNEITVDTALNITSTNPVQNKVITNKIEEINESITSINGIINLGNIKTFVIQENDINSDGVYTKYEELKTAVQNKSVIIYGTNAEDNEDFGNIVFSFSFFTNSTVYLYGVSGGLGVGILIMSVNSDGTITQNLTDFTDLFTIDTKLDSSSENAVQNKVIYNELQTIKNSIPTGDNNNTIILTQDEYDNLETKDSNKIYFIAG